MDCSLPGSSCPWGFSRQEYWSGLSCPPPGDLPNPGIEPRSPAVQAGSLPAEPPWKPYSGANGNLLHEDLCHMLHLLGLLLHSSRPHPRSRSLLTYASAGDAQTLTGRSGSLSFGHHRSFPWVLVHTRCLCPPSIYVAAAPKYISWVQLSCVWLCSPMDCSTPGFPVHHQLPELAQTHVYQAGNAIQPSYSVVPFSSSL